MEITDHFTRTFCCYFKDDGSAKGTQEVKKEDQSADNVDANEPESGLLKALGKVTMELPDQVSCTSSIF